MAENSVLTEQQYWSEVAKQSRVSEDNVLLSIWDNFDKKREIVRRILTYDLFGKDILEIGVGNGIIAASLMPAYGFSINFTITDTAKEFLKIASALLNCRNGGIAKANRLPFADASFDAVFLFDVLEHIRPEERTDSYKEIGRVLRQQGLIFINNPLTQSQHDEKFDFGMDDKDFRDMMHYTETGLYQVDTYTVLQNGYSYQFMVFCR